MPVLHLGNVPEDLYGRIERWAAAEQIPLTEAALRLRRQAVEGNRPPSRANVLSLLEGIRRYRITPVAGTPDSVDLLREDRGAMMPPLVRVVDAGVAVKLHLAEAQRHATFLLTADEKLVRRLAGGPAAVAWLGNWMPPAAAP